MNTEQITDLDIILHRLSVAKETVHMVKTFGHDGDSFKWFQSPYLENNLNKPKQVLEGYISQLQEDKHVEVKREQNGDYVIRLTALGFNFLRNGGYKKCNAEQAKKERHVWANWISAGAAMIAAAIALFAWMQDKSQRDEFESYKESIQELESIVTQTDKDLDSLQRQVDSLNARLLYDNE